MITYSTEFPLKSNNTVKDVLHLAAVWLDGSQHSEFKCSDFEVNLDNSSVEIVKNNEKAIIARAKGEGFEIGGVRYSATKEGLEWVTTIVIRKDNKEILLSLQVSCESYTTAVKLPNTRKPYFFKRMFEYLDGGQDGQIPVANKPFCLKEGDNDVNAAAILIRGHAKNRLPIVYVSAIGEGDYLLDIQILAQRLAGMAHVIVEPSRNFSQKLRDLVDGKNVYGGTIGVYWPESNARKAYFLDSEITEPRSLLGLIENDIRIALANRRLNTSCTWAHLQETLSRCKFEELLAKGSTSVHDYISAFDGELKAKNDQIDQANREIDRLNRELKIALANQDRENSGIIDVGNEQNLYENEIKDFILQILRDAHRNSMDGSRRQHVLQSILDANEDCDSINNLEKKVKNCLKQYRKMDSKTKSSLSKLGFQVSEEGKHYKLIFQGDSRYTFTLPKSGSDYRGGLNSVTDITSILC